jgi:hypothetical protein
VTSEQARDEYRHGSLLPVISPDLIRGDDGERGARLIGMAGTGPAMTVRKAADWGTPEERSVAQDSALPVLS